MKSIIQTNEECYICKQKNNLDIHHLMNGPSRKNSEKWGGTIYLCRNCHDLVHRNPKLKTELKQTFQKNFELLYGHEIWMKEFRKNYL